MASPAWDAPSIAAAAGRALSLAVSAFSLCLLPVIVVMDGGFGLNDLPIWAALAAGAAVGTSGRRRPAVAAAVAAGAALAGTIPTGGAPIALMLFLSPLMAGAGLAGWTLTAAWAWRDVPDDHLRETEWPLRIIRRLGGLARCLGTIPAVFAPRLLMAAMEWPPSSSIWLGGAAAAGAAARLAGLEPGWLWLGAPLGGSALVALRGSIPIPFGRLALIPGRDLPLRDVFTLDSIRLTLFFGFWLASCAAAGWLLALAGQALAHRLSSRARRGA